MNNDLFVNIGFSNVVNKSRVVCLLAPDTVPSKRLVAEAREAKKLVDCTSGRKTRTVLLLDGGVVVLCGLNGETIAARLNGADADKEDQ
ncbi:MAG: DUF370 domain-containing protein [Clostridia bacterium]|nr:DUF370 domain-containing protein [Clostridia bacterium]